MNIDLLETTGFRCYTTPQVLDFSALSPGFYAVQGENGAGKSTLFDLLHWVIFGQTSRGLRAGNIKSWRGDGKCAGELVIDGSRISRGWSPNYLRVDGVDVEQQALERALQLSPDVAMHTFYFSQFEDFFVDLKPLPRMEIYSKVLGLDLWEDKAEEVSGMLKKAMAERQRLEVDLARLEEREKTLASIDLSADIENWDKEQLKEYNRAKASNKELEKWITDIAKSSKVMALKYKTQVEEYKSGLREASELRRALIRAKAETQKAQKELMQWDATLRQISDQIDDFKELGADGELCPTCAQPISEEHARKHVKELERGLAQAKASRALVQAQVGKVEKAEKQTEQKHQDLTDVLSTKDRDCQVLAQRLQDKMEEEKQGRRRLRELEKALSSIETKENPFRTQHLDNVRKAKEARKQAKACREEISDAHNFEAALAFWQKGFKDIRYQVMQESLTQLNAEVNESLHDLGLAGWKMTFEVEQETKKGTVKRGFLCTVSSPDSPESGVPWESWSGGESQRLRTASELGVANMISSYLGINPSVEFWDEPSTWLNEQGIKDLLAVLQERAQRYERRIFIADHRVLDFQFDGTIQITKTEEKGSVWSVNLS